MISEPVLRLVRSSIKSVWALELLLTVRRAAGRSWSIDDLTREMRSNRTLVADILSTFMKVGLVEAEAGELYRYKPASVELDETVQQLERVYAERPLALVREIVSAPNEKIQTFADAFKLKKD